MEKKLVSIIIPNFNSKEYIGATIESILAQSYEKFELIIVDDCSSDGCRELINTFIKRDHRIALLELKKNNGRPAVPRNLGIDHAKGEYLAFMDSDDIWHRQKLELQIAAMQKTNTWFSCTALVNFVEESAIQNRDKPLSTEEIEFKLVPHNLQIKKNIMPNSSVMIRRDILGDLKFNEDARYKAIEDFHLWLRVLQNYKYAIKLNEELLYYRLAVTSISKSKFAMLKKNYMMYSEYQIKGKGLGFKKYAYLLSYIFFSVIRISKGKL